MKAVPEPNDEELLLSLAKGDSRALAVLYRRHVPTIFKIAAQSLGREGAEDIVQEVFASVWKHAETFDPNKGPARAWILQIARSRVLNELRRRTRKPESTGEDDATALQGMADVGNPPDETLWQDWRRSAIQHAVDQLAPPQRQALSLAFFDELTHEQVAEALRVPLGTAKTRIRSGIQRLRLVLATLAAALALAFTVWYGRRQLALQAQAQRLQGALRMVTASDAQVLRLVATPSAPAGAHGNYRTRSGAPVAVLTISDLPRPPAGKVYQAWMQRDGRWISLGSIHLDTTGHGLLVYEETAPLTVPEALQVTLEPETLSTAPTGAPLIAWPNR